MKQFAASFAGLKYSAPDILFCSHFSQVINFMIPSAAMTGHNTSASTLTVTSTRKDEALVQADLNFGEDKKGEFQKNQ